MIYGVVLNDVSEETIAKDIVLSGWILGKATQNEASSCSKELRKYSSLDFLGQPRQEMAITPFENGFSSTPLTDTSSWRYAVVRPTDAQDFNGAQLAEALRISDADLCVELWCILTALAQTNQLAAAQDNVYSIWEGHRFMNRSTR